MEEAGLQAGGWALAAAQGLGDHGRLRLPRSREMWGKARFAVGASTSDAISW